MGRWHLVENRFFPIVPFFPPHDIDVDGGRWIGVLDELEQLTPRIVVPGHGEIDDAGVIAATRHYLTQLQNETKRLAGEGNDADAIIAVLEPRMRALHPDWDNAERTWPRGSRNASASVSATRRSTPPRWDDDERIPLDALSRVSAYDWMLSFGLLPLGYLIAGPLGEAFGAENVMLAGAGLTAVVLALGLVPRDTRELRRIEPEAAPSFEPSARP